MNIVSRRKVEDCFDGTSVFVYEMSEPWSPANVRVLKSLGTFEYHARFPRPLFRLRTNDGLFVSGIAGTAICRVTFPRTNRETAQQHFEKVFQ